MAHGSCSHGTALTRKVRNGHCTQKGCPNNIYNCAQCTAPARRPF